MRVTVPVSTTVSIMLQVQLTVCNCNPNICDDKLALGFGISERGSHALQVDVQLHEAAATQLSKVRAPRQRVPPDAVPATATAHVQISQARQRRESLRSGEARVWQRSRPGVA